MDTQDPMLPEQIDDIERYLLHQMQPEEKWDFEKKLASDESLKKATDEMRLLLLGVQEATLSEKLDSFHKDIEAAQPVSIKKSVTLFSAKRLLLAASVIGIMILGACFLWLRKSETDRLFAQYFKPDGGLITAMGSTDNYAFDRAMVDYKTGNYDAAIRAWERLQTAQPASDTLNYFLGAAHLAANNAAGAIAYLQKVAIVPVSPFFYEANWYLGLCYLKEKNKKEAIGFIRKSNHPQKHALLAKLQE